MLTKNSQQNIVWSILWAITILLMIVLLLLIGYVFVKGAPEMKLSFIFGPTTNGGLMTPIVGTLYLTIMTLIFLIPLSVGTAVYLSEYAEQNWFTEFVRYSLTSLAGIPSIIFGLFGVALFVMIWFKKASIIAGSLTLTCLSLPFMVATTEEAIRSIPKAWREASYGLGATKWYTIIHVVLPNATSGILTGVIMSIGRVIAETAPLLATVGFSAFLPVSPMDGTRTLALHLFYLATEAPTVGGLTRNDLLSQAMAVGTVLIILIILLNFLAKLIFNHFNQKVRGFK
ncbi:phosphate ABC transporter permease PstA [bacterium]|nr:phosphate ABC transporter permease PstA [bacterium]